MASSKAASKALPFGRTEATRVAVVLLGGILIATAFLTPWWTRGLSLDYDEDEFSRSFPGFDEPATSYGPFKTPGAGGFSADASRAAAVAVLGVSASVAALFASASLGTRALMHTGRIEENLDVPVRFAIVAFLAGAFAIVWAGLFLPLLGNNPGWLYGQESGFADLGEFGAYIEVVRYANVGFFAGILGLVAYPAWLWADAARVRAVRTAGTTVAATPAAAY